MNWDPARQRRLREAWSVSCSALDLFLTDQKLGQIWLHFILREFGNNSRGEREFTSFLDPFTPVFLELPARGRTKCYQLPVTSR